MAFTSALHPHAPAGSPAGGQFTASGSQQQQAAKPATGGKGKTKPKGMKPAAGAKAAQAKARSVPFAELKRLTTMAHHGKKLTPAQAAIVKAGEQAHAAHVAHMAHVAAHPPKPRAAAKPKAAKKATVAKKPATTAPKK